MNRTSDVLVVLPTCRGYTIPKQTIQVDWCVVHDRHEWPVKVENDDNYMRPIVEAPRLEPGSYARRRQATEEDSSGETERIRPGLVYHIVAPRPEIYGERSASIRQAGFDYGYREGYRYVLTVDDDCILPDDWAEQHVKALGGLVPIVSNTVPGHVIRGLPRDRWLPVGISHGLWSGVLDYPAWWQISNDPGPIEIKNTGWHKIASPFPLSSMNVGFRREVLPAVYFQPIFKRHDDIFAGWVAQTACDLHGYGYLNGGAVVLHGRASNAEENLKKEAPGDAINGALVSHLRGFTRAFGDMAGTFAQLAAHIGRLRVGDPESDRLIQQYAASMMTWQRRNS